MDDIAVIEGKILLADDQLEKLPSELRFDEAHAGEKLLKLNHEKKRFVDCIKVFVCNLKTEMCRLLSPLRRPQRHAPGNPGQISSSDPLPCPIADPPEIFLKR